MKKSLFFVRNIDPKDGGLLGDVFLRRTVRISESEVSGQKPAKYSVEFYKVGNEPTTVELDFREGNYYINAGSSFQDAAMAARQANQEIENARILALKYSMK